MPKIIGLINSWYSERWIAAAIEQALQYCDEVIVAIGAHSKALSQLQDNTKEIANTYADRITLLEASMSNVHDRSKANTLNRMLAASKLRKPGNWIWILDSDEFYFDCSYKKIIAAIASGHYTHIRVEEKFFLINTTRYLMGSHGRLFRIGSNKDAFRPTQQWTGNRTKSYILKRDDGKEGMFHYSLLTDLNYRRLLWQTEHSYDQSHKVEWLDRVYIPYDLNNEDVWIEINRKLFGVKSPFFASEIRPDQNGRLFVYNGPHPPLVEKTGMTNIKDFRSMQ